MPSRGAVGTAGTRCSDRMFCGEARSVGDLADDGQKNNPQPTCRLPLEPRPWCLAQTSCVSSRSRAVGEMATVGLPSARMLVPSRSCATVAGSRSYWKGSQV